MTSKKPLQMEGLCSLQVVWVAPPPLGEGEVFPVCYLSGLYELVNVFGDVTCIKAIEPKLDITADIVIYSVVELDIHIFVIVNRDDSVITLSGHTDVVFSVSKTVAIWNLYEWHFFVPFLHIYITIVVDKVKKYLVIR